MQPKLRDDRLYWRGRTIWARVLDSKGHISRRSTKCHDETAAVAKANEFERTAADPRHAAAEATALVGAVGALLKDMHRRKRSAATLKKASQKLGHYIRIWGEEMPLLRLHQNAQIVLDYIDQRQREGASNHTIKMELSHLGMVLKIAIHLGTFPGKVEEVLPPYFSSGHKPRDRWLTFDEAAALIRHLERARAAHVMYFIATGARLGEAERALRSDTDWIRRLVRLHGTKTLLSDDTIPITVVNERVLRWALDNAPGKERLFKPWGKLHRDLAAACVRAGIAKCTPNDLRRTFAKWHRLAGVDVTTVSKLLRHADDKLAQTTYAKVTGNEVGDLAAGQIRSVPLLQLPGDPTVPILYPTAASEAPNEQELPIETAEKEVPPAELESAAVALGKRPLLLGAVRTISPRSEGNRRAWARRRGTASVPVLYLQRETLRVLRAGVGPDEVCS